MIRIKAPLGHVSLAAGLVLSFAKQLRESGVHSGSTTIEDGCLPVVSDFNGYDLVAYPEFTVNNILIDWELGRIKMQKNISSAEVETLGETLVDAQKKMIKVLEEQLIDVRGAAEKALSIGDRAVTAYEIAERGRIKALQDRGELSGLVRSLLYDASLRNGIQPLLQEHAKQVLTRMGT